MCLSLLDGSFSGDGRVNVLKWAMNYLSLLSVLTLSNARWISQLPLHPRRPKKRAVAGEHPGLLLARSENLRRPGIAATKPLCMLKLLLTLLRIRGQTLFPPNFGSIVG